ncbi:GTP cyclohydrolase II [Pseudonocardia nigra]|uniref:GTP cyclohydrolase II n=1 Tax=Pseudonocardia nigra TaxID=1921578 RepID=UPI001C5F803E|nr:GTP cyclohydrolase II [Pseudonocardia nigra]
MSSAEEALSALANKGMVLVVDDEDRENEGDLIMAAEHATTGSVAFFLEHTSGFLCVAIDEQRAESLDLGLMVDANTDKHRTAFLISVDYKHGTTTGISAGDRAATIRALADPRTRPTDLSRPGHVLPLLARPGGVLERPGHTEAGVDLCRMAGLSGAALLCEIVTPDRRGMMRGQDLVAFADLHDIPMISIEQLRALRAGVEQAHPQHVNTRSTPRTSTQRLTTQHAATQHADTRRARGRQAIRTGQSTLPTEVGTFEAIAYRGTDDSVEHLALVMGDPVTAAAPLVRLHSECITGDLAGSLRCDCGAQFRAALYAISEAGAGILVYLRGHEGRGIGLGQKLRAYELQQHEGLDTIDANIRLGLPVDGRDYGDACRILKDLGVSRVRLMTNNPEKVTALAGQGVAVVERIAHESASNYHNIDYLTAKRDRMGHLLERLS